MTAIRFIATSFQADITADCGCLQPQSAESTTRSFYFSQAHAGWRYTGFQRHAPLMERMPLKSSVTYRQNKNKTSVKFLTLAHALTHVKEAGAVIEVT
jgi:hypothetical protein